MIGRKDAVWLAVAAAILTALLGRALWSNAACLMNFGDLYGYHYPLRHLVASSLQAGRLPFWNAYIFAGLPLLANPQSVVFYPVALLGYLFPLNLALTWDVLFHWLLGWTGWMLLARREGLRSSESFVVGLLFALCPFVVYRITEGIPTLLAALAWTPWCWLAFLSKKRWRLSAAWALAFFSGHPQFLALNALAMVVWALTRQNCDKPLYVLAREGLGAAALSLIQVLPTREFLAHSVRNIWPAAYSLGYSLSWGALLTWIHPGVWGYPVSHTYSGQPSVFFELSGLFLGVFGMALCAWGLGRVKKYGAPIFIVLGLFIAAGSHNPIYAWLLGHTPLGFLRTPARALFLCLLGLMVGGAAALRAAEGVWRENIWLRAAVLALILIDLLAWDRRFVGSQDAGPYLSFNSALAQSAGGQNLRIMTDPALPNPDKAMVYRARNVNGYEAFYLEGYPEYAAKSEGHAAADASRSYLVKPDTLEMKELGVGYFLSGAGELRPVENPLPLVYAASDDFPEALPELKLQSPRPESWSVQAKLPKDGAREIVLAQPHYPGWRAWLNGEPAEISPWSGLLQSVSASSLKSGQEFSLEERFQPTGWPWLVLAAAAAWSAWTLSALLGLAL